MRPSQPRPHNTTNGQNSGQRPKADFTWKPKFSNTLPDLPYDGKFLPGPFVPISRFIEYRETDLERNFKRQTMCEMDVGVKIDLVDPDTYNLTPDAQLSEKDVYLLEDESAQSLLKLKRSAQHSRVVPFMRRTEYIASEFNRFGAGADRQETKVGYNLLKNLNPDDTIGYRDRESQIKAIEKTFEDVKRPVTKHYSKPNVTAVEESFIFPDFELWKYAFAQVIFDADPSYSGVPENLQRKAMENGLLSGMASQGSVGYFCPSVATIQKYMEDDEAGRDFQPDEVYEFPLNREYTWVVRNKASKNFEDDYVLHKNGDKYLYNELETRVKLNRKRRPAGAPKLNMEMHVTFREENESEIALIESRMRKLLRPSESDDEESAKNSDAEGEKADGEKEQKEQSSDDDDERGSDDEEKKSSSSSSDGSSDKESKKDSDSD